MFTAAPDVKVDTHKQAATPTRRLNQTPVYPTFWRVCGWTYEFSRRDKIVYAFITLTFIAGVIAMVAGGNEPANKNSSQDTEKKPSTALPLWQLLGLIVSLTSTIALGLYSKFGFQGTNIKFEDVYPNHNLEYMANSRLENESKTPTSAPTSDSIELLRSYVSLESVTIADQSDTPTPKP